MPGAMNTGQWLEIREQWEEGTSYGLLSKRYGITRSGIANRGRREGWRRSPETIIERIDEPSAVEEMHRKIEEKLVNVSRAATPREKAIAIESAADELTKIVREHRRAWLSIQQILKDSIRAVHDLSWQPPGWENMTDRAGNLVPFDTVHRLKYAKDLATLHRMLADGLITSQEGERRAHGIDFRITMKDRAQDEAANERREFLNRNITKLLRHVADRGLLHEPTGGHCPSVTTS
jgi:hypothetical protein